MSILIVDDSSTVQHIIESYLTEAGYSEFLFADSAMDAFRKLKINTPEEIPAVIDLKVNLILLDIILPDMDGIKVCQIIKSLEYLQDIPVIIVTSLKDIVHLEKAFVAGAVDFITKPINKVELLARIRSALKLKYEMDRRKNREQNLLEVTRKLEEAVKELNRLSSLDGLTGIANRRRFDEYIDIEWKRGLRDKKPLSLIMVDIDFFKAYNDHYGHLAGDNCLQAVASALQGALNRPGDIVCRYGGEEFAVVLPGTPKNGALLVAKSMFERLEKMKIKHESSPISKYVTVSMGVATFQPLKDFSANFLIAEADRSLYCAKVGGRNRIKVAELVNEEEKIMVESVIG